SFSINAPFSTWISTLSLHDALPIWWGWIAPRRSRFRGPLVLYPQTHSEGRHQHRVSFSSCGFLVCCYRFDTTASSSTGGLCEGRDRKSTRLNSSHRTISYAVFCLKK